jgi:signal transduction histidine kinase
VAFWPRKLGPDALEQVLAGSIVATVFVATLVLPERLLPLVTIGFFASVLLGAGLQSRAHAIAWVFVSGAAYAASLLLRPFVNWAIDDFGSGATALLVLVPPAFFWGYIDRQQRIAREFRGSIQQEMEERQRTELERARTEERSRAKDAFFATMSHELRTPLNAIIGYSEMLSEEASEEGDDALVGDLAKIEGAGRHLVSLIGDILDFSKLEAGKMEVERVEFSAEELLGQLEDTCKPLAMRNGNELKFSKTDESPLGTLVGDPTRVRQVLLNLLGNACKFTSEGTVELSARRTRDEEGSEWFEVQVSDTGVGIEPEQLARLFEPFTQADEAITRKYGGTGLGLALSARLAETMGGSVSATSEPGVGSSFRFRVPAS